MLHVFVKAALILTTLFMTATMALSREWEAGDMNHEWQVVFSLQRANELFGYIMDLDGRNIQPLMWNGEQIIHPACSSGGNYITFVAGQSLYVMNVADGQELWQWREEIDTTNFEEMSVSDNGQTVAFSGIGSGYSKWVINTRSSQAIIPDTVIERMGRSFVVSPDGRQIAFASYVSPAAIEDIYLSDADGSNPTQFITNAIFPNWSPDGTMLTFVVGYARTNNVYVMDVDRAHWAKVTGLPNGTTAVYPSWSLDGNHLMFVYYDGTDMLGGEINLIGLGSDNRFSQHSPRRAVSACLIRSRPAALTIQP
jgi:Tol biopolymer transport system component